MFLKNNFGTLEQAIREVFKSSCPEYKIISCVYLDNGCDGAGIYVNDDAFIYTEDNNTTIDAFLNDLNTDAAITGLDQNYDFSQIIPKGKGEHFVSWPQGQLNHQPILKSVWNPETCEFKWDELHKAIAEIPSKNYNPQMYATRGFSPKKEELHLPQATVQFSFVTLTQNLRKKLAPTDVEEEQTNHIMTL